MKQIVEQLKSMLRERYDERETKSIIHWLLEEICGWSRTEMLLSPERLVATPEQTERLLQIGRKMEQGEPMQYAVGYEYFCGRRFDVNPSVLIPRPETQEVINWIVDNCVNGMSTTTEKPLDNPLTTSVDNSIRILDIGTGSGCIAVTLALDINNAKVVAADLSTGALQTAMGNANRLNATNVSFLHIDILHPDYQQPSTGLSTKIFTSFETLPEGYQQPFDIIVSNPPYICHREKSEMCDNVLENEPHMALFVPDEDPLLFYRAIATLGLSRLQKGGWLYFEINAAYGAETCQLMRSLGYEHVELKQDFTGRDRFVRGQHL